MHVSKVYEMPVDAYGDVRTLVRGLPYQCPDDWEDVLDSLDEDSNLYLVKEPDNPKDKLAIAAYLDDRRVGYVAASDNGKIWLYLTDEKMPCKFIERFDASFKISFENPRYMFEDKPFEEIYRDKAGISDRPLPAFEIPFITNPKNKHYNWFDDKILIADLERAIPDFRRKLASRMIIMVGRKNKKAEYCYYLPYHNRPIADVEDGVIRGLIDRYGFVIALPDVPILTNQGYGIIMDLHVTYLKKTDFKEFSSAHHSQIVFNLNRDYVDIATEDDEDEFDDDSNEDNVLEEPNPIVSFSSLNDFFPLFGITLGKTTWKQAEDMGHKVEIGTDGPDRHMYVENIAFWDHDGEGKFTSLYWVYHHCDFSPLWKSKGFSWDNSYEEWLEVFKKLGFKIEVTEEPSQKEYSGYDTLSAEFWATSPDGALSFDLDFDYGDNGCYTSSPKSLYSISVNYEGACSQEVCHEDVEKGESYNVTDSPEGGKHVSMGVIVPEEGDEDFDFCTYECRISDKKQIDIITRYMKRYEEGKEPRPFLMIGRPCIGLDNIDIFYSLDGEIIFNFIFDEAIKSWIREAGFVLGKVKSYQPSSLWPNELDITLSVSKRKSGETLFKQASEEAMDFIEEYANSVAEHDVETRIIDAVKNYMSGDSATPYKVLIITQYGLGTCTTLDGEEIAMIYNDEIIELAEKNKGVFGYITKYRYDDDGDAWFTIRVSRSIPRLTTKQNSETSDGAKTKRNSSAIVEQDNHSTPPSISEEVFSKFISDNFDCDVFNSPNSSWEYDTTKLLGNDGEKYESYIFKKTISGNPISKEIQAAAVIGVGVNFCMDIKMNRKEILDFVYRYKKLFFPDYTLAKCKKEYGDEENLIYTKGISPALNVLLSDMGVAYFMGFQTPFCNKAYIDKQKAKGKILTL